MGTVVTGFGKDTVTQFGQVDNVFSTGGTSTPSGPGSGIDTVDGGFDFDFGVDGTVQVVTLQGEPGEETTLTAFVVSSITLPYTANTGDLLELDYSDYSGTGRHHRFGESSLSDLVLAFPSTKVRSSSYPYERGHLHERRSGSTHLTFAEIERLKVTGSDGDDVLVGTFDPANGNPRRAWRQ